MPFEHRIGGVEALRELYARPHRNVVAKAIDHIDEAATAFLARSTFAVLATLHRAGTVGDVSLIAEIENILSWHLCTNRPQDR
jgi:predicted pyridoxine 5'-phosphate oxidase superfamily flavin-nucleotide-binding protein